MSAPRPSKEIVGNMIVRNPRKHSSQAKTQDATKYVRCGDGVLRVTTLMNCKVNPSAVKITRWKQTLAPTPRSVVSADSAALCRAAFTVVSAAKQMQTKRAARVVVVRSTAASAGKT